VPTLAIQPVAVALAGVLGSVVGSFLNVCIFRLPQKESIVFPGSHCYSCGQELGFVDLIPVFSYLFLRGRCRHCGKPFSAQYPLVEALTAALFALAVYYFWGQWLLATLVASAGSALIVVFFIDLKHLIIPDEVTAIVWVTGLVRDVYWLAVGKAGWGAIWFEESYLGGPVRVALPRSLVGTVVGAGLFYAVAWLFERVFRKESMGGGDIKLAGAVGAWLGPGYQFLSFFLLAVFVGAVIGVVLMALRKKGRREQIPFGPMMAASALALMLWGEPITAFVLRLYTAGAVGAGGGSL